jgi:hypothetical protein
MSAVHHTFFSSLLGVPTDFEVPALVSIAGVLVVAAATKGCPCSKVRNTEKP